jgi:hypothetical protein
LQNIVKGTKQTIHLNVYSNGVLTQADAIPRVTIYDADDATTPLSGYNSVVAVDETPHGMYSFVISPALTQINRMLQVVWSYALSGVSTSETQYYSVDSVYASVSEIQDFLGYGANPGSVGYKDPKEIANVERMARTIIDGYTGQKFGTYYGSQEMFGIGSDACELTEKMLTLDKVWENGILVLDNTSNPIYNGFGLKLEITPTGKAIRLISAGWDVRYDNQMDPTILYYGRFRNGSRYKFQGQIGYKYVPEDIKMATMLLVNDILSNDYNWRNKYLQKVDLSEISFEMAKGAFNGTGNIAVDNILDQYRNLNIVII